MQDAYGDLVEGATAVLEDGTPADRRTAETNEIGTFQFAGLHPGVTYHVKVSGKGFPRLDFAGDCPEARRVFSRLPASSSTCRNRSLRSRCTPTRRRLPPEQVQIEEHQRVLGFIPNFYVVYDSQNVVPMTAKLKFKLALKLRRIR